MSLLPKKSPPEIVLSFSEPVRAFVRESYSAANAILEYGSGGSTVLAAELGKQVWSVESDPDWADLVRAKIAKVAPNSQAEVVWKDVGKIGYWGKPRKADGALRYYRYPLEIWDAPGFVAPDVILIDGRLRAACFVSAVMRIEKPTIVLFDDYVGRPRYQEVERLCKPARIVDRMAVFDLTPGAIPREHLTWAIGTYSQMAFANKKLRPEGG